VAANWVTPLAVSLSVTWGAQAPFSPFCPKSSPPGSAAGALNKITRSPPCPSLPPPTWDSELSVALHVPTSLTNPACLPQPTPKKKGPPEGTSFDLRQLWSRPRRLLPHQFLCPGPLRSYSRPVPQTLPPLHVPFFLPPLFTPLSARPLPQALCP